MRTLAALPFIFALPLGLQGKSDPALAVLEHNCIECHNQHDKKGDVVLDRHPMEVEDLELLLEVVSGEDPEMPPKRDPLKPEEVQALRKWIQDGAEIPKGVVLKDKRLADRGWWSLQPLETPQTPNTKTEWARNPIDQFVLAKLREKGLSPSPQAKPLALVRRLYFGLTGLPPTPAQVQAFLADSEKDPNAAYESLVDRLLASPHYGEHWARYWLDVARYGESHGYDKDKARFNAWPYRDYVIRSFNDDKPWTRFVQEQVAGDVLWPEDPDGIIALGFVAAGPWDFIAHIEVGEGKLDGRIAKHMDRDDMVSSVFNAFMSTTVQCAQCHNHKFDPVSMDDYYRLQAIFAGVDRADRVYDQDGEVIRKKIDLETRIAKLGQGIRNIENQIKKEGGEPLAKAKEAVSQLEKTSSKGLKTVPEHGYHSLIAKSPEEEKWVQVELAKEVEIDRIRLIGCHDNYAGIGAGFGFPVRFKVEVSNTPEPDGNSKVVADHTGGDFQNPGVVPVESKGATGRYVRVTATRLAERKNDFIFALSEIELLDRNGNNLALGANVRSKDSIQAPSRWQRKNLVDGKFPEMANPVKAGELAKARKELSTLQAKVETPERKARMDKLKKEQAGLRKELAALPKGKSTYTLATEFKPRSQFRPTGGKMRTIHFLNRGDMNLPGKEMGPGVPALWDGAQPTFDLPSGHSEGERRAELARYLTNPSNPLLWRSAANRIWLGHFGRGIVDSPNDFGRMGMEPTHPELLDWLAARLRDTGSLKDLHKLILMSSTYRQASAHDPGKASIDASNAYYWKKSRRKLRAEEMRDAILSVAGVLRKELGGPSFQDFKFKDDHTPKYWYHLHDPNDPKSHRRTIYRFIARSQTQSFLTTLDCADPSQMVAKRDETTTALQALSLMNNPFMEAMSVHFAKHAGTVPKAVWLAMGRPPEEEELAILEDYAAKHGMAATARLLLNLNEFAYVD